MAKTDPTIRAFHELGDYMRAQTSLAKVGDPSKPADDAFSGMLFRAEAENAWFTSEQVLHAMAIWARQLNSGALEEWLASYPKKPKESLTIALITAGNIPLVGFHDFMCVLLSGHKVVVRCASNDKVLLPFLAEKLTEISSELKDRIAFTDKTLGAHDGVIATGSNNTSRYFEHYFGKKPHIIRKNRNSVAVLTGQETHEQLAGLAEDVFRYFGMGCRSVSKLFVPENYDFDPLFQAFYAFKDLIHHQKYANNYDYNKAVFLMSGDPMLDNGFLLLKEDSKLGSPIGTLFYETYQEVKALEQRLLEESDQLQCVVGPESIEGSIPFGESQNPGLSDFADGVDTLEFLFGLSAK